MLPAQANKNGSVTATFDVSGCAILRHILVSRHVPVRGDSVVLPRDGASYSLAVIINGLPEEILQKHEENRKLNTTLSRGVHAQLSSVQTSEDREGESVAQLKFTWPCRLMPGRHPQRLEVATSDPNCDDPISSCSAAPSNLALLPTQEEHEELKRWRLLESVKPPGGVQMKDASAIPQNALTTLKVSAGDCLPLMRLVVRAEDGKDITSSCCRTADLRADLFASTVVKSAESAAGGRPPGASFPRVPLRSMTASAMVVQASSEPPASSLSASSSNVAMVVRDAEPLTTAGSYEVCIFYTSRRCIQAQDLDANSQSALTASSIISSANSKKCDRTASSTTAAALLMTPPGLTGAGDTAAAMLCVQVNAGEPCSLKLCRGQLVETSVVVRRAPFILERGLKLRLVDAYGNACGGPFAGKVELSFHLTNNTELEEGNGITAKTSSLVGKSTIVQPLANTSDAVFYPHGRVVLSVPIDPATGTVTFPRIALHTSNENENEDGSNSSGNGDNKWIAGHYALRAVHVPLQKDSHSCAKEASTKSFVPAGNAAPCFEATVDLFPDASEHEAVALRKQRALVQKRAVLAAKATSLAEASRAVEAEYESRKQQLQRLDADLESLRKETSYCLAAAHRARILTGHRNASTFELPPMRTTRDKEVSRISDGGEGALPAEPAQVVLREAVLERCYALKAGRHRSARLGGGLKHDNELRKMVTALDDHLRTNSSSSGGGSSSGDSSSEKHCLGLVGDSAWVPPHESGLAVSIAAQLGTDRLRAVILRRSEHRKAACAYLCGDVPSSEMRNGNQNTMELNDPGSVAFCALDELDCPNEVRCVLDSRVGGSCRNNENQEKVELKSPEIEENDIHAADKNGFKDIDAELAAAAAFEGFLDGQPLLDLPLPPLGLSASELRARFNWRGHAINYLQFPATSAAKSALAMTAAAPELACVDGSNYASNSAHHNQTSTSLRRALWLPLLGAASVFDNLEDALNCRADWRAAGGRGFLGPLLCRDGSHVDEFGFAHGAPTNLPGSRSAKEGNAGSGARRHAMCSREIWLSEPPLEACKEFRSMKALESALATESAQVVV